MRHLDLSYIKESPERRRLIQGPHTMLELFLTGIIQYLGLSSNQQIWRIDGNQRVQTSICM